MDVDAAIKKRLLFNEESSVRLTTGQSREVKKLVTRQQELKVFVAGANPAVVDNVPVISGSYFDITQGSTDSQRIGDSLTWCGHIDLRFQMFNSTGASTYPYDNVRFVIFQWFGNQTPLPSDLFINGPTGASPDIYSQYNHSRRNEYVILFDSCFSTSGTSWVFSSPTTSCSATGVLDFVIPLTKARKNVQFVSGGITGTNRLYIYYVGENVGPPSPNIIFNTKVVFRDG